MESTPPLTRKSGGRLTFGIDQLLQKDAPPESQSPISSQASPNITSPALDNLKANFSGTPSDLGQLGALNFSFHQSQSLLSAFVMNQIYQERLSYFSRRMGHPYQNRTPPKRKKPRTSFNRQQVSLLEERFAGQKYLASSERSALAKALKMTDAQVKTWFQNRRTKWRRQKAEERDQERQAANRILVNMQQDTHKSRSASPTSDDSDLDDQDGPELCGLAAKTKSSAALSCSSLNALQNLAMYSL